MFLKYGTKEHLEGLKNGGMFFNPCKVFQDMEREQLNKGQGDRLDSSLTAKASEAILYSKEFYAKLSELDFSVIVQKSQNTPMFCIKVVDDYHISKEQYEEIKKQSEDWTHVLVIKDEVEFLENVRFSMKNKAFGHKVFYENVMCDDFIDFLKKGESDFLFYKPKASHRRYYMDIKVTRFDGSPGGIIRIDDSNYYKTMYKKDVFFKSQNEYRIVLPYESIDKGKLYSINPFEAEILDLGQTIIGGNI